MSSLFESWYSLLLGYACRATGSLSIAEDIVQDSFLALYKELLRGWPISNPKGWTLTVVRRQISKRERDQVRRDQMVHSLFGLRAVSDRLADQAGMESEDDALARLLCTLTRREEEVVLLRIKAFKYRQIASQLQISINSVKTLLARALRKMRQAAGKRSDSGTSAAETKATNWVDDEGTMPRTLQ